MRAIWLAAGTVFTSIVLVVATALLYNGFADADPPIEVSRGSFPFHGSQVRLVVEDGVSDVLIQSGEAGEVVVERQVRWLRRKPEVTEEWGSGTLRVSSDCQVRDRSDRSGPLPCEVGYSIAVPPETSLDTSTASTPLQLANIPGKLRVTSVSGDVHMDGVPGDLHVRSGSGDVEATALSGERADVEVGTGRVHLGFRQPPAEVRAVVRTSGTVSVEVPRRATYDVTATAPKVDVDVPRQIGAPRRITASVAEGVIDICCD
ncbi:DUF4097 family beta strand repeat-containing protein [Nonomuraea rhodomycinica]|uniref:DUF4097 family beta strand repeat protein n=1 Tax=Nonomuraea rhodomycinica TaxID=1712872 RepID=A0A7Y6IVC5_9ACTN|nr:DUF4097 family beta strand repeat-containing protein [Nonomuraea rhodomycinica]NUW45082.1 DUF4097 family beta strand repeat protein [Nonomuraea rhodomycinica]